MANLTSQQKQKKNSNKANSAQEPQKTGQPPDKDNSNPFSRPAMVGGASPPLFLLRHKIKDFFNEPSATAQLVV